MTPNPTITALDEEIALLGRKRAALSARQCFRDWCIHIGYQPMKHHDFIIKKLQEIAESKTARYVILLCPPGVAKSTYTSKAFPAWYLGFCPGNSILACSYSKDLAASFGRTARNYVDAHSSILGYTLAGDSKAADEWETSTHGRYFCAGVGAGIAGHRADLGLIDDYLGNQEDADSKVVRNKQWEWFITDFWPRISGTKATNDGSVVIIANRRHEDDLVGRLLRTEGNDSPIPAEAWEIIKLPFFAETNDPLGRLPGEVIWPEKFGQKAQQVLRMSARLRAGLYQQSPRAEDGDYFRNSWLCGYEPQDLPKNLRIYAASDHACSEKNNSPGANSTVMIFGGWDGERLWILPDCWWERKDTGEVVRAMLRYGKQLKPLTWWAEKGHISKSIGPFLRDEMQAQSNFFRIEEVVPVRAKDVRARSAQGLCEFKRVMFPKFAPWWGKAEDELLAFPGGRSDDFVDAFAHLCRGIDRFISPDVSTQDIDDRPTSGRLSITLNDVISLGRDRDHANALALEDR